MHCVWADFRQAILSFQIRIDAHEFEYLVNDLLQCNSFLENKLRSRFERTRYDIFDDSQSALQLKTATE